MNRKNLSVILSCLYLPALGVLDIFTGSDLSLLVLYLVPIAATAWFAGTRPAILVAFFALAVWFIAELAFPVHVDLSPTALVAWGSIEKTIVFSALIALVLRIRNLIEAERARSLIDFITGLPNRRAFNSTLPIIVEKNTPFCLVFMELAGLDDLYLDRGEAYVDLLLKEMAAVCRRFVSFFRYSDTRFSVLVETSGPTTELKMVAVMEALKQEVFERRELHIEYKIGIAECKECGKIAIPKLLRFLAGGMIHLHGRAGNQVEAFPFC